jgi:hypothetical protein
MMSNNIADKISKYWADKAALRRLRSLNTIRRAAYSKDREKLVSTLELVRMSRHQIKTALRAERAKQRTQRHKCDGCEGLKLLAAQIDDEPDDATHVEVCFTCGKSRAIPGRHDRVSFFFYRLARKISVRLKGQASA